MIYAVSQMFLVRWPEALTLPATKSQTFSLELKSDHGRRLTLVSCRNSCTEGAGWLVASLRLQSENFCLIINLLSVRQRCNRRVWCVFEKTTQSELLFFFHFPYFLLSLQLKPYSPDHTSTNMQWKTASKSGLYAEFTLHDFQSCQITVAFTLHDYNSA